MGGSFLIKSMPPSAKKLTLINPCVSNIILDFCQRAITGNPIPYALFTLAALTPQDYSVKVVNQKRVWTSKDFVADTLVGITCLTNQVSQAYWLADRFRQAGSKVVLGGFHVSALPEEALLHADSVVIGEGESVWGAVICDYEHDALQSTYRGEPLQDFFTPVFDYFKRLDPGILARSGVHIDRGCKYHCDFCARISSWLRSVNMDQVLALIQRIADAHRELGRRRRSRRPGIAFDCDNIYSNPQYAKELFRKMIPLKVSWMAGCSIDMGFDEEALQLAQESGCHTILIGIETIHPGDYAKTSLNQIHSGQDYLRAIRNIKRHRIRIIGSFILGLDSYRHRDYLRLLWFIMRARLWNVLLTILTPFPGSELHTRLKQENRIRSFDWRKYHFLSCVIKPKHTSVFGVYFWFVVIRYLSVFFSTLYAGIIVVFLVSYEIGSWLTRRWIYGL
jgi:radical SAM superfamily enzyme YgiQ (UPF0313 family)